MIRFLMVFGLLILTSCRTAGADVRQELNLPYPDTGTAQITLSMTAGTLDMRPVEAGEGISGVVTTNVGAWTPTTVVEPDGTLVVRQGDARTDVIPRAENHWQIGLGTGHPVHLNVSTVAANSTLNVGGLTIPQLTVTSVSGNTTINYSEPLVDVDRSLINVTSTSGNILLTGLLNSMATTIRTVSTSGNHTLEFNGVPPNQDMHVSVESSSGSVTLRVAEGVFVNVKFLTRSGIIAERSPTFLPGANDSYETEGFSTADQSRLFVEVQTVAGDLRLVSVPPL